MQRLQLSEIKSAVAANKRKKGAGNQGTKNTPTKPPTKGAKKNCG